MNDAIGDVNDRVAITVGGRMFANCESYKVSIDVFAQPSTCSFSIGTRNNAYEILSQITPNMPFQVTIGGALQQSGFTDEPGSDGGEGTGTVVVIRARDASACIHDAFMTAEVSFSSSMTYLELARKIVAMFPQLKGRTVSVTNDANRKVMSNVSNGPASQYKENPLIDEILGDSINLGAAAGSIRTKIGDRAISFLKRYFDRAGLFFWASSDGNFVLGAPNSHVPPIWSLTRRRGQTSAETNILSHSYRNGSQPPRYSECWVYARAGGKGAGRGPLQAFYDDAEMQGWGIYRPLILRDGKGTTSEQGAYLARRKLAEGRRATWHLAYTLAGHSFPVIGSSTKRAIWAPDTTVNIWDEEIGLFGTYWISGVDHERSASAGTRTTIRLMRLGDLFFGADE